MLSVEIALPDVEELHKLVEQGQEKGFLTYDEIVNALEDVELTKEQIEDFYTYLIDHSIELMEGEQHKSPPHEQPALAEDEKSAPKLDLTVEPSLDSLRLYLREMERAVSPRLRNLIHKEFPKTSTPVSYEHFRKNRRIYKGQREELRQEHGREFTQILNFEAPVPAHKTAWWELRGFLRFAFLTPALTDHVLPLLLAAGTLIYCGLLADWRGNLLGAL